MMGEDSKIYEFNFQLKAISKDNEKNANRRKSLRFEEFERTLGWLFKDQKPKDFEMFTGDIAVDIEYTFTSRVHCDLPNLPKSVCDAFNKLIYRDDRQIRRMKLETKYGDTAMIKFSVYAYRYSS